MQLEAHPESKLYDKADLGSKSQKESLILTQDPFCSDPRQGYSLTMFFRGFDDLISMLKCGSLGNKE